MVLSPFLSPISFPWNDVVFHICWHILIGILIDSVFLAWNSSVSVSSNIGDFFLPNGLGVAVTALSKTAVSSSKNYFANKSSVLTFLLNSSSVCCCHHLIYSDQKIPLLIIQHPWFIFNFCFHSVMDLLFSQVCFLLSAIIIILSKCIRIFSLGGTAKRERPSLLLEQHPSSLSH